MARVRASRAVCRDARRRDADRPQRQRRHGARSPPRRQRRRDADRPRRNDGTASIAATAALLAIALFAGTSPASAGVGQTIVEKCTNGEPFSGYTAADYREALNDMETGTIEYSPCANLIRKAELAAAGGGTGASAGTAASKVALPLTPAEQRAVQRAHSHGSAPVAGRRRDDPPGGGARQHRLGGQHAAPFAVRRARVPARERARARGGGGAQACQRTPPALSTRSRRSSPSPPVARRDRRPGH